MTDPHVAEYGHVAEEPPTWWAYRAACAAIEKHRVRADTAEALLDKVRGYVGVHGDGAVDVWSLREVLAGREVRL